MRGAALMVRARVAVFMRIAQAIRRGKAAYKGRTRHALRPYTNPVSISDVFEFTIIPYLIAAETWGDGPRAPRVEELS